MVTVLLAELGEALALHGWRTRIRIPYRSAALPSGWRSSPEVRIETGAGGARACLHPGAEAGAERAGLPRLARRDGRPEPARGAELPELVLAGISPAPAPRTARGDGLLLVRTPDPGAVPADPPPLALVELRLPAVGPGRGEDSPDLPLGTIPEDPALWRALAEGRPAAAVRPGSPLVGGVRGLAAALLRTLRERVPAPRPAAAAAVTWEPAADTP